MKFYSEELKKLFDSEKELVDAEEHIRAEKAQKELEEKNRNEARKAMAAEVEIARKESVEANKKYYELLQKFCKQYGTYHTSLKLDEFPKVDDWFGLLSSVFDL